MFARMLICFWLGCCGLGIGSLGFANGCMERIRDTADLLTIMLTPKQGSTDLTEATIPVNPAIQRSVQDEVDKSIVAEKVAAITDGTLGDRPALHILVLTEAIGDIKAGAYLINGNHTFAAMVQLNTKQGKARVGTME